MTTVQCVDCGVEVAFTGGSLLDLTPAVKRLITVPVARCNECYRAWQETLTQRSRDEQQTLAMATSDLLRFGRKPPASVLRDICASGFAAQWGEIFSAWERSQKERRTGRTDEVE
jgi:hypothetical protein